MVPVYLCMLVAAWCAHLNKAPPLPVWILSQVEDSAPTYWRAINNRKIWNTFDTPPLEPLKFIFNRKKETYLQIYCCIYKKNKLGTIHFKFQSCIIHSTCFPARDVCLCNENLSLLFTTVKASLSCHHHVLNSAAQPINAFSLKLCYHLRGTVFPDV